MIGHHFQGQKVKGQGHQAALVGCASHYLTYMDDNRVRVRAMARVRVRVRVR